MNHIERKEHWENIYQTKALNEVSWYQPTPETSLNFIVQMCPNKYKKIVDIGGGDSFLVDHLLKLGYQNITVLDISEAAIERAKLRLGNEKATKVNWIVSDVTAFESDEKFDLWHDRAAFHFLTSKEDIQSYIERLNRFTNENAGLIIGTFSENGPLKCSGIEIQQYSAESLTKAFESNWKVLNNLIVDHTTPFKTQQNFIFSTFSKKH